MATQMSRFLCSQSAHTQNVHRSMRAVRANSSAPPFEWVAEREKGKNMDRLSIFCRSLAGGAIIGIGVLIAQQAVAQESV